MSCTVINLSCGHPALSPWQEVLLYFSQQHEICPSKKEQLASKIPLYEQIFEALFEAYHTGRGKTGEFK